MLVFRLPSNQLFNNCLITSGEIKGGKLISTEHKTTFAPPPTTTTRRRRRNRPCKWRTPISLALSFWMRCRSLWHRTCQKSTDRWDHDTRSGLNDQWSVISGCCTSSVYTLPPGNSWQLCGFTLSPIRPQQHGARRGLRPRVVGCKSGSTNGIWREPITGSRRFPQLSVKNGRKTR